MASSLRLSTVVISNNDHNNVITSLTSLSACCLTEGTYIRVKIILSVNFLVRPMQNWTCCHDRKIQDLSRISRILITFPFVKKKAQESKTFKHLKTSHKVYKIQIKNQKENVWTKSTRKTIFAFCTNQSQDKMHKIFEQLGMKP